MTLKETLILTFGIVQSTLMLSETRAEVFSPEAAVVKVSVVQHAPSYLAPKQKQPSASAVGSGCFVREGLILTCAHLIEHAAYIEVRNADNRAPVEATIAAVSHDLDLALLRVDKSSFPGVAGMPAIDRLPAPGTRIKLYGYPAGGTTLNLAGGSLTRIEHSQYAHGGRWLLTGQIDAPVNPGASGGPTFHENRLVGIAMQADEELENTGYVIPGSLIKQFLADFDDDSIRGTPQIGIRWQALEAGPVHQYYAVPGSGNGVLITAVPLTPHADFPLQEDDVLLAVDGRPVAADGTLPWHDLRVNFEHLANLKQDSSTISVELWRQRKRLTRQLTLSDCGITPQVAFEHGVRPRWHVRRGLVFTPLTFNRILVRPELGDYGIMNLFSAAEAGIVQGVRERTLLASVIPGRDNRSCHDLEDWVIDTVNGHRPQDFADFVRVMQETNDDQPLRLVGVDGRRVILMPPATPVAKSGEEPSR